MSTKGPIDQYLEKYRAGYIAYAAGAAYVQDAVHSALSSSGILANVSSRAKDADRLHTKLLNMEKEKPFKTPEDIEDRIVDIIGVRVTLYFPSQVPEVLAKFESLFPDSVLDFKDITDTKDTLNKVLTAQELLTKFGTDEAMKKLGTKVGPGALPEQKDKYPNGYGNYRAVHIRFTMQPNDLGSELRKMLAGRLKVEVQVQTLLMHSWSEVNHDLSYKTLSGNLSKPEYQLLDCLNGVGKLGEHVLFQLKNTLDYRLKEGKGKFDSSFELAEFIRKEAQTIVGETTVLPVLGDADDFLDFLNTAGKNDRTVVTNAVKTSKQPFDKSLPVIDSLLPQFIESKVVTLDSPFLLAAQNTKFKTAHANNKYEVLATIFDLTCRPILQSTPEKLLSGTLQFPLAFMELQKLGLYNDAKPAMPKTAFPVNRTKLVKPEVQTELKKLVVYFEKRTENAIVQQYLRHAQIRAWKQYGGRDFTVAFT